MPEQPATNQDENTLTYLSKLGANLLDSVVRRFSNPLTARRNRFILLVITALVLTVLILPSQHFSSVTYKAGDIATSDLRAPQDYLVEDHALTEQRRKEAAGNAPVIYNLSDRVPLYLVGKLEQALTAIRQEQPGKGRKGPQEWRKVLSPLLDTELSEADIRALTRVKSDKALLADAKNRLDELYRRKILLDGKVFQTDSRRGVEILSDDGHFIGAGDAATSFTEIAEARRIVSGWTYNGLGEAGDSERI